jgi:carbon storage regulator
VQRTAGTLRISRRQREIAPEGMKESPMLVLSRQRDESIIIGDNIVVTIVDIRGDKVRLGIDAPTEIPVHRREVFEAIQRENQHAAQIQPKEIRGLEGTTPTPSVNPRKP